MKKKILPWVRGWRYGNIPNLPGYFGPDDRSYNYRDNSPEFGTSVVQLEGGQPFISMAIVGASDRPKVWVEGWLSPETGGDGEPLIIRENGTIHQDIWWETNYPESYTFGEKPHSKQP